MKTLQKAAAFIATVAAAAGLTSAHADVITDWNAVTVRCVQGGPTPANRSGPHGLLDIALVEAAVHDAVQAIQGCFEPYEYENSAMRGVAPPKHRSACEGFQ